MKFNSRTRNKTINFTGVCRAEAAVSLGTLFSTYPRANLEVKEFSKSDSLDVVDSSNRVWGFYKTVM